MLNFISNQEAANSNHNKWLKFPKNLMIPSAGKHMDQQRLSFTAAGSTKWCAQFGRQFRSFLQFKHALRMLLLSRFRRVRLCVTPEMAAHQAPPSLGYSRQEHWSGLPFPSPTHESEKWKWSRSVVSDSSRPRGLHPTRLLHPWDFPGKSAGVGCHCLL